MSSRVGFLGKVPILQKNGLFRERPEKEKVPIGLFGLNIFTLQEIPVFIILGLGLLYAIFMPFIRGASYPPNNSVTGKNYLKNVTVGKTIGQL
jgi:hypothetical protein